MSQSDNSARTLIAGVGNIFLSDDAFGVAVARQLAAGNLPPGVRAVDFGIRAIHLAYEILDARYDTVILVDTVARGGTPGDLYVIEPDLTAQNSAEGESLDAHSMNPDIVLGLLRRLGAMPRRLLVVGCEPLTLDEGIGLSAPVTHSVEKAVSLILQLLGGVISTEGETDARVRPM